MGSSYKSYIKYIVDANVLSFVSKMYINLTHKAFQNLALIHYIGRKPWCMSTFRKFSSKGLTYWYFYAKFFVSPKYSFKFKLVAFFNTYVAKYIHSLLVFKKFKKIFKNSLEKRLKSTFI